MEEVRSSIIENTVMVLALDITLSSESHVLPQPVTP